MQDMRLTTAVKGVGASVPGEILDNRRKNIIHRVRYYIIPTGVIPVTAAKIQIQGSVDNSGGPQLVEFDGDGPVDSAVLAVGSTPEKIAFGQFSFRLAGVNYNKAADAVGVVFSDAHKVALTKFGAINVYIAANGVVSTWIDSAGQDDEMTYATAALALANAQASDFPHPASNLLIGTILINADAGQWVANTDDLTDASDLVTATFFNYTSSFSLLYEYTLDAVDIKAQKGVFYKGGIPDTYLRLFLSVLTGDGQINIAHDTHITSLPG